MLQRQNFNEENLKEDKEDLITHVKIIKQLLALGSVNIEYSNKNQFYVYFIFIYFYYFILFILF